jgi:tRNA 2-thiouridine synthesizing protein A
MSTPGRMPAADAEWDAGDLGCGELVLTLRTRLQAMEPGEILRLIARDPGAPPTSPPGAASPGTRWSWSSIPCT